MPHFWKYEKVDTRDDVKTEMPADFKVVVYKVISGDSGKTWYVQIITGTGFTVPVCLCNCPEGTFRAPMSVVGLGPQCKHAENLAAYLKERKQK